MATDKTTKRSSCIEVECWDIVSLCGRKLLFALCQKCSLVNMIVQCLNSIFVKLLTVTFMLTNRELQVYFPDSIITALTTPLSLSLQGWWDAVDGTDLQCSFFYKDMDDTDNTFVKLNALSNPLEQGIAGFTLPEGKLTAAKIEKNKTELTCLNVLTVINC